MPRPSAGLADNLCEGVVRLLGPVLGRGGLLLGGTGLLFGRIGLLLGSLTSRALDADLLRLLRLSALGFGQLGARRGQGSGRLLGHLALLVAEVLRGLGRRLLAAAVSAWASAIWALRSAM